MTDRLGDFLDRAEAARFEDGRRDCLMWVADWVLLTTGLDPAAPYRGRYRSPAGAARILKREGGMAAAMQAGARRAGLGQTSRPGRGDVGLLVLGGGMECAGICIGPQRWAMATDGLLVTRATPAAAWEVPWQIPSPPSPPMSPTGRRPSS